MWQVTWILTLQSRYPASKQNFNWCIQNRKILLLMLTMWIFNTLYTSRGNVSRLIVFPLLSKAYQWHLDRRRIQILNLFQTHACLKLALENRSFVSFFFNLHYIYTKNFNWNFIFVIVLIIKNGWDNFDFSCFHFSSSILIRTKKRIIDTNAQKNGKSKELKSIQIVHKRSKTYFALVHGNISIFRVSDFSSRNFFFKIWTIVVINSKRELIVWQKFYVRDKNIEFNV